jgi:hypothetical protein
MNAAQNPSIRNSWGIFFVSLKGCFVLRLTAFSHFEASKRRAVSDLRGSFFFVVS